jgi:acyl CoA:acetate/3-ketoacid CoA transferase beta subunit
MTSLPVCPEGLYVLYIAGPCTARGMSSSLINGFISNAWMRGGNALCYVMHSLNVDSRGDVKSSTLSQLVARKW